ncbi:hypothetical protein CDD82_4164 [Ophiocordyceps australis]|uniref:Uncharacterized protein n=1 Tax=Ophiocordyceps australis TaxID=1399860 RepID=A0A2C5Z849_9HYPO|nr:hypothetical protein CDD82_4164 [Ophiocordyceps australis]
MQAARKAAIALPRLSSSDASRALSLFPDPHSSRSLLLLLPEPHSGFPHSHCFHLRQQPFEPPRSHAPFPAAKISCTASLSPTVASPSLCSLLFAQRLPASILLAAATTSQVQAFNNSCPLSVILATLAALSRPSGRLVESGLAIQPHPLVRSPDMTRG